MKSVLFLSFFSVHFFSIISVQMEAKKYATLFRFLTFINYKCSFEPMAPIQFMWSVEKRRTMSKIKNNVSQHLIDFTSKWNWPGRKQKTSCNKLLPVLCWTHSIQLLFAIYEYLHGKRICIRRGEVNLIINTLEQFEASLSSVMFSFQSRFKWLLAPVEVAVYLYVATVPIGGFWFLIGVSNRICICDVNDMRYIE